MDVVSSGADPSDSIDVLEAQDSGERLTHRVLTVLGGTRPMSGWGTARPRATAEPALEDWAASYLGPADDVVVAEVGGDLLTLADAGLAALDLVFAEPTALDGVLRAALPGLGDAALAMTRQPAWPASRTALGETAALAGALRAVVAGAQPLLPGDLARPGTRPERDLAAALPELCSRARSAAAALGAAVSAMAAQVHALPEDGVVADEAAAGAATALAHRLDPFGIPLSPEPARPLDVSWVRRAWESAEARAANAALDRRPAGRGRRRPGVRRGAGDRARRRAGRRRGCVRRRVPAAAGAGGTRGARTRSSRRSPTRRSRSRRRAPYDGSCATTARCARS